MNISLKNISVFAIVLVLLLGLSSNLNATTYYTAASGTPTTLANWWTATNGTGTHPANFTTAGDIFIIQSGHTMTSTTTWSVTGTLIIDGVFTAWTLNLGVLTIRTGGTLNQSRNLTVTGATTITGTIRFYSTSTTLRNITLNDVTLNSGSIWNEPATGNGANNNYNLKGNLTNNASAFNAAGTGTHTFSGATKTISGTTITSIGKVAVTGTVTNINTLTVRTALSGTGTLVNGNGTTGTLFIGGTTTITTLNATVANNLVNYTGVAQTAKVTTYTNLTLSGSLAKTFSTTPTVNGVLSMEGTAMVAVTTGVVTYGTNAALQYNSATSRTTSSEEWITPFAASGGVIIANTGVIIMNEAKVFNASIPLTINSGATLDTKAANSFGLTLGGNFINNGGTFTAYASPVSISNTMLNQSIAGFTTTGTIMLSKSAGTATLQGNVNGGPLTINGSGTGTLNLGTGLIHTFTGDVNFLGGALNGGSSTLNENNLSSTAFNGNTSLFTAGTGTVNFGGSSQSIAGTGTPVFNNLTVSNTSAKTFTNVPTVNGVFTISGTATVTAAPNYGANATLFYNTSVSRTSGVEWITPFVATGGVIIGNTGTITINAAKVFNSTAPLTINSGSALSMASYLLTLNGNFVNNGGTSSGTTGGVTITGTASQSIGAFTTTGTVLMNKTGGTAIFTGDINGAGLTINGSGGTLNLGIGFVHTFTGVVTLTAGSLNGGNSTLNENAVSTFAWNGTGSIFTPADGTVNFGASGNQTIAANSTFNDLALSGSGNKTFSNSTTINANLSISGSALADLGTITTHTSVSLIFNGVSQLGGSWGSNASTATNKSNTYFLSSASGILSVNCNAPSAPVSGGNQTICSGQSIPSLSVTVGSGETAYWYTQASGGTLLASATLTYTPGSAGTFYAGARTVAGGCVSASRTGVTLIVNPLPAVLSLTGSTICTSPGDNGTISSSTSFIGVNYQLYNSGNATVQLSKPGTGSGLSWTGLASGTGYYIIGTNATTACTSTSGTVNITANANPTALSLTGSTICASPGNDGSIISTTSAIGVNYQLYDGSNNPVQPVIAGTGAGLDWISLTSGSGFYVTGVNAATSCVSAGSNTVNITTVANPAALVITGSIICSSPDGDGTITSSSSETDVDYQLYDINDMEVGTPIPGTGSGLTWSALASGSGYYVAGTNASTSCVSDNSNVVNITTTPNPTITSSAAATALCFSNSSQNTSLSYSATTNTPTNYTITWNILAQTAGLIDLGSTLLPASPVTVPVAANVTGGIYNGTLKVSNANGCLSSGNSFTLTIKTAPVAPTGSASQVFCSGATVSGLSATGTSVLWYAAASGGSALAGSTALVNGTHYYASQTLSGCESSSRLDVAAIVASSGSWLGTTSTNWFTTTNWCGGALPTASTNVTISAGLANYPSIGSAGAVCNTISIESGASLTIVGSNTLTVSGNWINNGTFTANTSTVIFNGASSANIGASNFYNLTFSGAGTKTATGALTIAGNINITGNFTAGVFTHTVSGNWSNSGTFTANGSTIDFNGSGAGNIGAGNFNNITFSGAGTKTATAALAIAGNVSITGNFIAGSFTHTVGGDWTKSGSFTFTGSTIDFNGSGSGNIGSCNFNNIIFSGAGTKTATGALNILGSVTISNNFSGGSYFHSFQGDWINNGTFTANTSTFNFFAASPQNIGGSSSSTFYNFIQGGTGLITLGIATSISGTLTLTLGLIDIGNYNLTIIYPGSISGGSAISYIQTSGTGRLKQTVAGAGSVTKNYPVGNSAYNPMTVKYNDIALFENISIRVADGTVTNANTSKTVNRKWFLIKDGIGSADLTLAATYNTGEEGTGFSNSSSPQIAYFDGTSWAYRPISSGSGTTTFVASGSAPEFSSTSGFFVLGSGDAFNATKLVVSNINPANPSLGLANTTVTVQSQNSCSVPTMVAVNSTTGFDLSCSNTTMVPSTPTGIIIQNTYQTTVSSIAFTTATGGLTNATVTATRTSGDVLTAGTSAPFDVINGSIYEPVATQNWDAVDGWRMSTNGGSTWTNPASLPGSNVFGETDLIRIPLGITLTANITASFYSMLVYGTLDVNSSGALTLYHASGDVDYNIHIHGTLKNSGGTITNSNSAYPFEIHGGTYWHNMDGGSIPVSTFSTLASTLSSCQVQGTGVGGLNQIFENFILTSGTQTLAGDMTVSGDLTLTAGKITTGSYHVIVGLNGTASNSGSGYINGTLRRYVPSTTTTGDFPVGDASYYAPFSIAVNSGTPSGNGYLDVSTAAAQPVAASGLSQTKYVNRKWSISNNGVSGIITYNPSCTFDNGDKIGSPATGLLKLRKLTSGIWYTTNGAATGNTILATALSTAGLTATSDFYVGEDDCSSTKNVWIGSISTDWNTAPNWCSGSIPDAATNVTIPSSPGRQPVIGSAGGTCNDITIESGASLTISGAYILNVKGNWSDNGSFNAGTGTVSFAGSSAQVITGTSNFDNLTINNTTGVSAVNNITVNGILNLTTANPDATHGTLDMGSNTLNAQNASASITGIGDITGIIKRTHSFVPNIQYQFGSQFTSITFLGSGTQPSEVSCKITLGSAITGKTDAVQRYYSFARPSSETPTDKVVLNLRYLSSEINGNDASETKLVIWDRHSSATVEEHGKTNNSTSDHWVGLSGLTFTYIVRTTLDNKLFGLADYSSAKNTWTGASSTDWNTIENWTFGHAPYSTEDALIPDVSYGSDQYPVLSSNIEIKTLEIAANASVSAGIYNLTINGFANAWQNNGTFIPGTGTVNFTHGNINEIVTASGVGTNQFHNINIAANTFIKPGTGFYLKINGWVLAQLSSIVDLSTVGTTVEYNGPNQTIVNPSHSGYKGYYNLVFSGTGTSNLYDATLDIYGNYTSNGTLNLNGSTVSFIGTTPQNISGINAFNNLTINNSAGVTSDSDLTVNGILYLETDNPSLVAGALDMASGKILNMGDIATTTGIGDVTGIIKRTHSFTINTDYSFGNQNTVIRFPNVAGQTLPTSATIKVTLGTAPSWTPTNPANAINRIMDIAQTDGNLTKAILRAHFRADEIPVGVNPVSLSFWINKTIAPDTYYIYEKGRTEVNTTANYSYISVDNVNLAVIPANLTDFHTAIAPTAATILMWNGSQSTDWTDNANWTPNSSTAGFGVMIPDANTTPNTPVLPVGAICKSVYIETGGILNSISNATLSLTGQNSVWSSQSGGIFNAGTSTVSFINTLQTFSGTTNFFNILISDTTHLAIQDASVMGIAGAVTKNTGILSTVSSGHTTVNYNGGDQTVVVPDASTNRYYNLILSGSGTKTLPSLAINILGDFTIIGTASVTAAAAMSILGNVTIGSGANCNASTYSHSVGANWTNDGAFTAGTSTLSFNGNAGQAINGASNTLFNNLTLNNSNGLSLNGINAEVDGTLTFTSGKITTGTNHLTLGNAGVVSGAGTGKYVFGVMQKGIAISTASKTFEIGNATNYLPATIDFAGTATNGTGYLTCSTTYGQQANYASSGLNQSKYLNRYWSVTNSGVTFGTFDATFTFIATSDEVGSPIISDLLIKRYEGSWYSTTTGTSSSTTLKSTGNTAFGDFVAGEALSKATDYFRSTATGNWSSASSWESSSDSIIWGQSALFPDNSAHSIIVSTGNSITVDATASASNLYIIGSLILGNGIDLGINGKWGNSGNFIAGTGTIIFNGASAQTINGVTVFNNLTINNSSGVSANADLTVNGELNLNSANPSATKGALYMGLHPDSEYLLYMGASSTTTGLGDASGYINRSAFALNTPYTFGNQFTLMDFTVGPLPSSVTMEIYLSSADIEWKPDAVHRYFDVTRLGGSADTRLRFNVHYLDTELNGAIEGNLDLFDYHVSSDIVHDHGFTDYNTTDNWVGFGNVGLAFLGTAAADDHFWTLGTSATNDISIWIGGSPSGHTDWDLPGNWEGGTPRITSQVIIPGGLTFYPVLPVGSLPDGSFPDGRIINTIEIQPGGVLNATTGTPALILNGASNAWNNNGTFNAGTSNVLFTNAAATMDGITDFYSMTVADGAGLTPVTGNLMRIAGIMSLSSTGILNAASNPNIIEYNGSGQTVVMPNGSSAGYSSLLLSGSGAKTMPGSTLTVSGELEVLGTASVTALAPILIGGEFDLMPGATFVAGSFTHTVGSNWNNTGTFTSTGSTINFNGNAANYIGASNFNNITISGTGTKTVTGTITLAGNFELTSGAFVFDNPVSNSITISGNYNQSGGVFDFNTQTSGTTEMNLGGNISQTSGAESMTTNGAGAYNGVITFNGSTTQTLSLSEPNGAIWVKYSIPSGKSVRLLSDISLNGADAVSETPWQGEINISGIFDLGIYTVTHVGIDGVPGSALFTVNSGATLITANAGGISGSVSNTDMINTFSSAANYEFQGSSTGTFITTPDANTVNDLTINNSSGDVSLTNSLTVAGLPSFKNGKLTLSANSLTLTGSSPLKTSGFIDASASGSLVAFAGSAAQSIPTGLFYNNEVFDLTINNTENVQLNGTLRLLNTLNVTSGRLDATTNSTSVVYASTTPQTILASQYLNDHLYDFTSDNSSGVTLNASFTINNNLVINSGKLFSVGAGKDLTVTGSITNSAGNAGFVLLSDATGTASLLHNTNTVPATIQRYISGATEAWHFLSSPVAAQSISGDWLPSGTYGNGTGYDLYLWNEPTNCWIYKTNANWSALNSGTNFVPGRGYLYSVQAANPTKAFAGNLNNGTSISPLTFSSIVDSLKGFNLVGNPYPSSIDWKAASGWTRDKLAVSGGGYDMWIWNQAASNYGVYNSLDAGDAGTNSVSRYIAVTQGFFVKAISTGNLVMTNNTRVHDGAGNWFKVSAPENNSFSLAVHSDAGSGSDEIKLGFDYPENENGAQKLFSTVLKAPSLYMPQQAENLSVRYLTSTAENPRIPVNFTPGQDGDYTITCNFNPDRFETVKLLDQKKQKIQDIKSDATYHFKASKTDAADRFILYFGADKNGGTYELPARIYTDGTDLNIDLTLVNSKTTIIIYDALGRVLLKNELEGFTQHTLNLKSPPQILVVQLRNQQGSITRKVFYQNNY